MTHRQLDALLKHLAEPRPRRGSLQVLAGAALAGLLARFGGESVAVAAGCRKVDKPCRRADQCCSGVCRGRRGNKTCRDRGAGTCKRGKHVCNDGIVNCNNKPGICFCYPTTAGTSFCGTNAIFGCAVCQRDADCEALGFPPGSACVTLSNCKSCPNTGGTACYAPCNSQPVQPIAGGR